MNNLKYLLLAIVFCVALFTLALKPIHAEEEVQYCYGKNISETIKDDSLFKCPFAHIMDEYQGRCISYSQIISKFLHVKCQKDDDCAQDGANSFFVCENKKCVYSHSRSIGDRCEGHNHCRGYSGKSSSIVCHSRTKRCAIIQEEYTAAEGALCGYNDGSAIIMCRSGYECDYNDAYTEKRCKVLKKLGEVCQEGSSRYNCANGTNNEPLICFPSSSGTSVTCRTKLTEGEKCYGDDIYCADGYRCVGSFIDSVCTRRRSQGQECTSDDECEVGLSCGHPKGDLMENQNRICQAPRNDGEECVTLNCASSLTCVRGMCRAGNLNDPCQTYSCKNEYACGPNDVCIERVAHGLPCNTTREDNCMADGYCRTDTYVCQKYGQLNDECNDDENRYCYTGYSCSRGRCIAPYSISNGGRCASNNDCAEGYCDEYLKVCANKKRCLRDTSGCTCICSAGKTTFGTCLSDYCGKYKDAVDECDPSWTEASMLDTESTSYKRCRSKFQTYIRCQAKMYKIAAPFSPIRSIPGYNLEGISAASSVAISALAVAVSIISYLFM